MKIHQSRKTTPVKINGHTLKLLAAFTMLLDHIGYCFWETGYCYTALRTVGRLAFPLYCFLLVEGVLHTRSVRKYGIRLALFAIISEVPFNLMISGHLFCIEYQNVFFTLLLGLLVLIGYGKFPAKEWKQAGIFICGCTAALLMKTDYGAIGITVISIFYWFRDQKKIRNQMSGIVLALESLMNFGTAALAVPIISLYNGERGKVVNKYFFYWFYPIHIVILYWLRRIIFGH